MYMETTQKEGYIARLLLQDAFQFHSMSHFEYNMLVPRHCNLYNRWFATGWTCKSRQIKNNRTDNQRWSTMPPIYTQNKLIYLFQ